MFQLQVSEHVDHPRTSFRLRKDEALKLRSREWAPPVKNNQTQVLLQRQLSVLESLEGQTMPFIDLSQIQLKGSRSPATGMMIPSIGEQDVTDIEKQAGYRRCLLCAPH